MFKPTKTIIDNELRINPPPRISDDKLRALLHDRLPQAPRNPWFVRKVMNRLPAKRHAGLLTH